MEVSAASFEAVTACSRVSADEGSHFGVASLGRAQRSRVRGHGATATLLPPIDRERQLEPKDDERHQEEPRCAVVPVRREEADTFQSCRQQNQWSGHAAKRSRRVPIRRITRSRRRRWLPERAMTRCDHEQTAAARRRAPSHVALGPAPASGMVASREKLVRSSRCAHGVRFMNTNANHGGRPSREPRRETRLMVRGSRRFPTGRLLPGRFAATAFDS